MLLLLLSYGVILGASEILHRGCEILLGVREFQLVPTSITQNAHLHTVAGNDNILSLHSIHLNWELFMDLVK